MIKLAIKIGFSNYLGDKNRKTTYKNFMYAIVKLLSVIIL